MGRAGQEDGSCSGVGTTGQGTHPNSSRGTPPTMQRLAAAREGKLADMQHTGTVGPGGRKVALWHLSLGKGRVDGTLAVPGGADRADALAFVEKWPLGTWLLGDEMLPIIRPGDFFSFSSCCSVVVLI